MVSSMSHASGTAPAVDLSIKVELDRATLEGNLAIPDGATAIVLFAQGSGNSRHSPRNHRVAAHLHAAGLATFLVDLLTEKEEFVDRRTTRLRFDLDLLAERIVGISHWLASDRHTADLALGYFGASIGCGPALTAAARLPDRVRAIVSRGGRPDLAGEALAQVRAPTLLVVGGEDAPGVNCNYGALVHLGSPIKKLVVVPGATHFFEEPGKLDEVAELAAGWFDRHLTRPRNEH